MSRIVSYQVFVEVVETGSLIQAAAKLHYSPAALSKQISKLEESLNVQLFHRSHKRLDITQAGRQFYPKCKSILAAINQAEDELLAEHEAVAGTLCVTLSKALARSNVFDALSSFAKQYPKINFDIRFSDQFEDMHNENLDFAFRLGKLTDHSHVVAIPLMDTQLVACATKEYLLNNGTPQSFSDLGNTKLITQTSQQQSQALKRFFKKEKLSWQNLDHHSCDDIEGVYQAVKSGMGIGMLLDIATHKELTSGEFKAVLCERNLPRKKLYLMYKKSQWQTQAQLAFKRYMKKALEDQVRTG